MKINVKYLLLLFIITIIPLSLESARRTRKARIGRKITFKTADGILIKGLYKPPKNYRNETFVFLHGLGSNQEEWQDFIRRLVKYGYGFLSYDARGHGESIKTEDGKTITYERFKMNAPDSHWNKMIDDLGKAVEYLQNKRRIPLKRINIMGASLGANIALNYASSNDKISKTILLSPGISYAGINTTDHIAKFDKRPILLVASPDDTYSYQSCHLLYKHIKSNKKAKFFSASKGHGVIMLNKRLRVKLINWLIKNKAK